MFAFRKAKATKPGVNDGKGAPERSGDAFIGAQRKPLRQRGAKPPQDAARSDSALDAHASIGERGTACCHPDDASAAVQITAQDNSGWRYATLSSNR